MGEGWGEGISESRQSFPNTLTALIQALRLVALSLTLSHGRENGAAVGAKGSARKTGCAGCFLFFRRPAINACLFKLLFKSPATVKPAAICSLPRGGGLGRGHSPNCNNLSNTFTTPIQALRLAALSLTLSHGREDGVAVRVKGSARKQVVQAALCCSDDLYKCLIQSAYTLLFSIIQSKLAVCYRAGCFSNSCNTRRISASTSFVCCKIS